MFRITCEFIGGPHDGRVVMGDLGDGSDAERFYLFSNRGAVGQRLKVASPYAVEVLAQEGLQEETPHRFRPHYYTITECLEDEVEVLVRAEYVPELPIDN